MGLTLSLLAIAAFSMLLGWDIAYRARMRNICRKEGHLWESDYTGLECSRCYSRH